MLAAIRHLKMRLADSGGPSMLQRHPHYSYYSYVALHNVRTYVCKLNQLLHYYSNQ